MARIIFLVVSVLLLGAQSYSQEFDFNPDKPLNTLRLIHYGACTAAEEEQGFQTLQELVKVNHVKMGEVVYHTVFKCLQLHSQIRGVGIETVFSANSTLQRPRCCRPHPMLPPECPCEL